MSLAEVCPLAIPQNAVRFNQILENLQLFKLIKYNGSYFVEYSDTGCNLIRKFYPFNSKDNV